MVPMDPRDCLVVWPPSKRSVCAAAGVRGSGGVGDEEGVRVEAACQSIVAVY